MADNRLDEFFAKKDKKKKKKSPFTTSKSIAQNLEDGRKTEPLDPSCLIPTSSSSTPLTSEQEDEEWKCVDEERDYSGLKIQSLSISDKFKEEEQLKEQMAEQSEETAKSGDGQIGPWKIFTSAVPAVVDETEGGGGGEGGDADENTSLPDDIEVARPVVYVPPSLRGLTSSSGGSGSKRHEKEKKSAPELTSELDFPSLSAAAKGKNSDSDKSFQSVKHGVRSKGDSPTGPKLDLENKFSALPEND